MRMKVEEGGVFDIVTVLTPVALTLSRELQGQVYRGGKIWFHFIDNAAVFAPVALGTLRPMPHEGANLASRDRSFAARARSRLAWLKKRVLFT
jgi:hypothetical protein